MKRKFLSFISVLFVTSNVFLSAGILDRVFEVKIPVDVRVANNTFAIGDYLNKQEVVIDLNQIADSMSPEGFLLNLNVKPDVEINLNLKKFRSSLKLGADVSGKFNLDKELFEFLGNGNMQYTDGTIFDFGANVNADAFASVDWELAIKNSLFTIGVKPAVFVPVASVTANKIRAKTSNVDGNISAVLDAEMNLRSCVDLNNAMDDLPGITNQIGFDMGIVAGMNFGKKLTVNGAVRIPVMPGKLTKSTPITCTWKYENTVDNLISQQFGEVATPELNFGTTVTDDDYYINRPLKLNASAVLKPFGSFLTVEGGFGFGIRHPFAENPDETFVFPEYNAGLTLSLVGLVSLSVKTELTEQLYVHSLGVDVNVRLVEVYAGLSLAGSSFESSFKGSGVGAYVMVAIGI